MSEDAERVEQEEESTPERDAADKAIEDKLATIDAETREEETADQDAEDEDGGDGEDSAVDDSEEDTDTDEVPELPADLLSAAKFAGLSEQRTKDFWKRDHETAKDIFEGYKRTQSHVGKLSNRVGRLKQEAEAHQQEQEEAKGEPDEKEEKPEPEDWSFSDEDWTPEGAAKLNRMAGVVKELGPIQEMVPQLKEAIDYLHDQREREAENELETFFGKLESEDYPNYGQGPTGAMDEDGPELDARTKLAKEAFAMMEGRKAVGLDPITLTEALEKSLLLLHPDVPAKKATQKVRKKVEKRSKQLTARPTQRRRVRKDKMTEEEEAAERLEEAIEDRDDFQEFLKGDQGD